MNIKNRVSKLESASYLDTTGIRIARFIVDVDIDEPTGYRCGEAEIIRNPGEAIEALHKRCHDTVIWPEGN